MMSMSIWLLTFFSYLLVFAILKILWSRRKLYMLSAKLNGPFAWPLIGNALIFNRPHYELFGMINNLAKKYKSPMRLWLGPKLFILFTELKHAEHILTSNKFSHKHEVYDFMKPVLDCGLISDSGPRYKKHKKVVQPQVNKHFVTTTTPIFNKHFKILMNTLEKQVGKPTFNIKKYVHLAILDIMGATLLGGDLGCQVGRNPNLPNAIVDMYELIYKRMLTPWCYPDFTFYLLHGKKYLSDCNIYHTMISNEIDAVERGICNIPEFQDFIPLSHPLIATSNENPDVMNRHELINNLASVFAASEDTMTIAISFACLCFGMNPEYQNRAAEEVRAVVGETPKEITYEELSKLEYLEMCIKDVLRLSPIAPYIIRRVTEEVVIDDYVIPKECAITVGIYHLHKNPEYWENPEEFHPDHFLEGQVRGRPTYAFLPFSAGPRGCIGKLFAYTGVKLGLAHLLQKFVIEADGKVSQIPLRADISVRPIHGYNVRLKRRVWK